MTISVISFSPGGCLLSRELGRKFIEWERTDHCHIRTRILLFRAGGTETVGEAQVRQVQDVSGWVREQFACHRALLFIGACGIAVRYIAPFVRDKLKDSPVLVMDETGRHVIPILAGHAGGANALAEQIAAVMGAEAVITTATDITGKFAADRFAQEQGFTVQNKAGIAQISSRILAGETVTMAAEGLSAEACEKWIAGVREVIAVAENAEPDIYIGEECRENCVLWLKPRKYILGVGCKRGKKVEELFAFVQEKLAENDMAKEELLALASIEEKAEEEGLWELADRLRLPFFTYPAEELAQLQGDFSTSEFVRQHMGVDNVCERAALLCSGEGGRLILKKTVGEGMTLAVAKRDWRISYGWKK